MMSPLTKLEKIVLLLAFYTSPVGAAKHATWEFYTDDKLELSEDSVINIIRRIVNSTDEKAVDWSALDWFLESLSAAQVIPGASEGLVQ